MPAVPATVSTPRREAVGHVVSLIGHTYDPKRPLDPKLDFKTDPFVDSSSFLNSFLICDDNRFPYANLGFEREPFNDYDGAPNAYHIKTICVVTCPMPEKAYLVPDKARAKAMRYIKKIIPDLDKTGVRPFVVRFFLTTCNALREDAGRLALQCDQAAEILSSLHMPHFVWVLEVSPIAEYQKGKATAVLLLDPTAAPSAAGVIAMRVGNVVKLPKKIDAPLKPGTAPDTKEILCDSAPVAFEQFTHNLGRRHKTC